MRKPKTPEQREATRVQRLAYRQANRELLRERERLRRLKPGVVEREKVRQRAYRKSNPERVRAVEAASNRKWAAANKEHLREQSRKYREAARLDLVRRVKILLAKSERHALKAQHLDTLVAMLAVGRCAVTGVAFDLLQKQGPFTPHLDRIDPKGGYVIENVQWVCGVYNLGKQHWAHEDFMVVARAAVAAEVSGANRPAWAPEGASCAARMNVSTYAPTKDGGTSVSP